MSDQTVILGVHGVPLPRHEGGRGRCVEDPIHNGTCGIHGDRFTTVDWNGYDWPVGLTFCPWCPCVVEFAPFPSFIAEALEALEALT